MNIQNNRLALIFGALLAGIAIIVAGLFLTRGAMVALPALDGTSWQLSKLNGLAPVAGGDVTLEFTGDRMSGSGGINSLTGSYTVQGGTISFGQVASTMMAGPEDLMQQESTFLQALNTVTTYRIEAGTLVLTSPAGELVFVAA